MNDLNVTVTGWLAGDPVLRDLGERGKMCTFRFAHTPRFRAGDGEWRSGDTEWISARMFRSGAQNVSESLHKGQPVVVQGRLGTNTWRDSEGAERTELQMDVTTVGHDLTKGTARFSRTVESGTSAAEEDTGGAGGSSADEPVDGEPDLIEPGDDQEVGATQPQPSAAA